MEYLSTIHFNWSLAICDGVEKDIPHGYGLVLGHVLSNLRDAKQRANELYTCAGSNW